MSMIEKAYDEMVDVLARGSSPADIVHFRPSPETQKRATDLLEKNRVGELSASELAELERFGQIEQVMQLVKAKARFYRDRDQGQEKSSRVAD